MVDDLFNLQANLRGYTIAQLDKEIKAVTYHGLEIVRRDEEFSVSVVFDI